MDGYFELNFAVELRRRLLIDLQEAGETSKIDGAAAARLCDAARLNGGVVMREFLRTPAGVCAMGSAIGVAIALVGICLHYFSVLLGLPIIVPISAVIASTCVASIFAVLCALALAKPIR